MDVLDAIRARRTCKQLTGPPLTREVLDEVLGAARWAPNHRLTEPWRFRVVGPDALVKLKKAAGAGAVKLDRAPTLVVASYVPSQLELHAREDEQAAASAVYAALLAATARGIGSYWRTPAFLRSPEGRRAAGLAEDEVVLGLLHFGRCETPPPAPERKPATTFVTYLS